MPNSISHECICDHLISSSFLHILICTRRLTDITELRSLSWSVALCVFLIQLHFPVWGRRRILRNQQKGTATKKKIKVKEQKTESHFCHKLEKANLIKTFKMGSNNNNKVRGKKNKKERIPYHRRKIYKQRIYFRRILEQKNTKLREKCINKDCV